MYFKSSLHGHESDKAEALDSVDTSALHSAPRLTEDLAPAQTLTTATQQYCMHDSKTYSLAPLLHQVHSESRMVLNGSDELKS